jgi:hypothetical protein
MVLVVEQDIPCLNINCKNKITGFGLTRLNTVKPYKDGTMRFSKWRICQNCRNPDRDIVIKCKNEDCGKTYMSSTGMVRMYCTAKCRIAYGIKKYG